MINFVKEVLGGDYIEIFLIVYLLKFVDFCLIYICYNDYGNLIFILNLINGQEVNVVILIEYSLENNGKFILGIKIVRNQGVIMNV